VIFTSTVPVSGNGVYVAGSFTPVLAGIYRWIANYSGDANNAPTANTCNGTNENVVVAAAPPPPPAAACPPITLSPATLPEAVGPVLTLHEVSTCGTLVGQNSYILTADLKTTGTCLTIAGNGASLDLNGHSISGVPGAGAGIVAVSPGNNMTIKGPGIIHDFGFCVVLGNYALVQDVLVYNCNNVGIGIANFSKCVGCRVHDVRGGEVNGIGIQMGLGCLLESSIVERSDCGAVVGSDCSVWDLVVDTVAQAGLTVSAGTSVARTVISHFHDGPGLVYNCAQVPGASGCQDSSNSVSLATSGGAVGISSTGNVTTDCATNVYGTRYQGVPVQCPNP
jgi:hypothetical protein